MFLTDRRAKVLMAGRASGKAWVPCIGLAGRGTTSDA